MATFKAVVRGKRDDGTCLVYIRCTHNRGVAYIKTGMYVSARKIDERGNILDNDIIGKVAISTSEWQRKLNMEDLESWTVKEVVDFLDQKNTKISFLDFCDLFINRMVNDGREKSASNYRCAVKSFEASLGSHLTFQDITSNKIQDWIKSLSDTARAKSSYPKAIKAIFEAGCLEYNDYDRNRIRITNQPFRTVKIPKFDTPKKRAIDASLIKNILICEPTTKRSELAHDV